MFRTVLVAAASTSLGLALAAPALGRDIQVIATIRRVDGIQRRLLIERYPEHQDAERQDAQRQRDLRPLARTCRITLDRKPAGLADLAPGMEAVITYSSETAFVSGLEVSSPLLLLEGKIMALDFKRNRISVRGSIG